MPRQVNRELKPVGAKHEPGPYKFKVVNVTDPGKYDSWKMELQTWTESGGDGPKVSKLVQHSNYKEDWMEDEPNRICQVLCGKMDIDMGDLMGRSGYVVLGWDKNGYLSPVSGGFFTADRKDAFGEETMSEVIEYAMSTERPMQNKNEETKKSSQGGL